LLFAFQGIMFAPLTRNSPLEGSAPIANMGDIFDGSALEPVYDT
jgi:hypothetical protein